MSMYDPIIKAIHNAAQKIKGGIDSKISHKADLDSDGLVPLSQLPPATMEHMVTVADDTARFALTTADVQNGDTVYVDSTEQMYMVVDDTHLSSETGYKAYAAGTATRSIADKNGNDITTTYQPIIGSSHMLSADLVDDTNNTHKFVTATDITKLAKVIIDPSFTGNLYISSTAPTGDIPDGSVGVGW